MILSFYKTERLGPLIPWLFLTARVACLLFAITDAITVPVCVLLLFILEVVGRTIQYVQLSLLSHIEHTGQHVHKLNVTLNAYTEMHDQEHRGKIYKS